MQNYEIIADSTLDLEVWVDLKEQQHWVNSLVLSTLGYQKADLVQHPEFPNNLITPAYQERFQQMLLHISDGHTLNDMDIELLHQSGRVIPAALSAKVVLRQKDAIGLRMSIRLIANPSRLDSAIRQVIHFSSHAREQNQLFNLCRALYQVANCDGFYVVEKHRADYKVLAGFSRVNNRQELTIHETELLDVIAQQGFLLLPSKDKKLEAGLFGSSVQSAVGVALYDPEQQVRAIVLGAFHQPMSEPLMMKTLFQFFAQQLSSELRRFYADTYIQKLNTELEHMVEERTHELEQTLEHLQQTQQQLIQSEKMASLTSLVAGVAHKLNTPISNALISSESLYDGINDLQLLSAKTQLTRQRFESFIQRSMEASLMIINNMNSASKLVNSFKELASPEKGDVSVRCSVVELLRSCKSFLSMEFTDLPDIHWSDSVEQLVLQTYHHILSQVVMHILTNSIQHAFQNTQKPSIYVDTAEVGHDSVMISFHDNGKGISKDDLANVFDPFFTSSLSQGTSGLGLHLCFNLVTGPLQGTIMVESEEGQGCVFHVTLPRSVHVVQ